MLTYLQTAGFQHEFETFKGSWFPLRSPMTRKPQTGFFFNSTLRRLQATSLSGPRSFQVNITSNGQGSLKTRTSKMEIRETNQSQQYTKKRTSLLKPAEVHRDSYKDFSLENQRMVLVPLVPKKTTWMPSWD